MKKYRITPAKRDLLGELLKGSALPERELNKLTNACTIEEVVVTPQIPRWEIVLHTEQLIEDALLAKAGDYIRSRTYSAFTPYIISGLLYLGLTIILTKLIGRMERRLRNSDH